MYSGPKLQPGDALSPDLPWLGKSLVILKFLMDTFPEARLLPSDPFLRAKAHLFCHTVKEKFIPAFIGFFLKQALKKTLYNAVEHFQNLLLLTGFMVGEWLIADAAFLPFYLWTLAVLEVNLASLVTRSMAEVSVMLSELLRLARIQKYFEDSMAQLSTAKTWDPVRYILLLELWSWGITQETFKFLCRCWSR